MRKIALSLLCASALLSNPIMAMQQSLTTLGIEYELPVNLPEIFTNFTFFTIHAVCKVESPDASNVIHVKALNRTGQINGHTLTMGDELNITVHNGESFDLIAESAAQVEFTNKGQHLIKADCQLL